VIGPSLLRGVLARLSFGWWDRTAERRKRERAAARADTSVCTGGSAIGVGHQRTLGTRQGQHVLDARRLRDVL
jgi:hypothetical protein